MIQRLPCKNIRKNEDASNDFIYTYPDESTQYIVAQSSTIDPFYDFSLYDNRDFSTMNLSTMKSQGLVSSSNTLLLNDYCT